MSEPLTLRTDAGDEWVDLDEFEKRVRRGELSPRCLVRFSALTGDRFVPAGELPIYRRLHEPRHAYFARYFRLARFPWTTSLFAAACIAVYVASAWNGPLGFDALVRMGAKVRPLITDLGQGWRLLAANFIHRDALHLGLNLFVLFNVGGALENAYRTLDYLWLLLFSGVATMTASLFLANGITVGASGMVYGCLGGVVVFGLKYRSILPSRYRRILGEAAIPTLLVFLWIGWTSAGVDNAAHLGGLIAGLLTAPFLRPRLLSEPSSRRGALFRAAPSLLLLAAVTLGPLAFRPRLPLMRTERDDGHGLSVPVPLGWKRGAHRLGELAYFNGLPGVGRASFAMGVALRDELADPRAEAEKFLEESLSPKALGPEVLSVEAEGAREAEFLGADAAEVHATIRESGDTTRMWAYFVPRGELVYQLVFTYSESFPAYERVLEEMKRGVRFDEPRALREARAKALLFPQSTAALSTLGETLRRLGEPGAAVGVLEQAVRQRPDSPRLRSQLALALLQVGDVQEGCDAAAGAAVYGPSDPNALEVGARCELARQNPQAALLRLMDARKADPSDERLMRAEEKLKAILHP
ncbi:MAG TPA: rhomboid family intramembrane serine protease [Myxococcaceae bacterium]|nr:rhomboid family intramembrane serine protease [Myxococcaceae bacterium]